MFHIEQCISAETCQYKSTLDENYMSPWRSFAPRPRLLTLLLLLHNGRALPLTWALTCRGVHVFHLHAGCEGIDLWWNRDKTLTHTHLSGFWSTIDSLRVWYDWCLVNCSSTNITSVCNSRLICMVTVATWCWDGVLHGPASDLTDRGPTHHWCRSNPKIHSSTPAGQHFRSGPNHTTRTTVDEAAIRELSVSVD